MTITIHIVNMLFLNFTELLVDKESKFPQINKK